MAEKKRAIFVRVHSGSFRYDSLTEARESWIRVGARLQEISHDTYVPVYGETETRI